MVGLGCLSFGIGIHPSLSSTGLCPPVGKAVMLVLGGSLASAPSLVTLALGTARGGDRGVGSVDMCDLGSSVHEFQ